MDKVLWAIVVPIGLIALAVVYGACYLLIPETVPVQQGVFVPRMLPSCRPEPREDTQYIVSIVVLAGILFAGSLIAFRVLKRRGPLAFDRIWLRAPAFVVQLLYLGFVAAMVVYQDRYVYRYWDYRKCVNSTLVAAILLTGALVVRAKWRATGMSAGNPGGVFSGVLCILIALCFTLAGLSSSVYREHQPFIVGHFSYHVSYQMAEFAAVQNGSTPYVDFFPQYQSCISYLTLPIFKLVELNMFSFTCLMVVLAVLTLLPYYYVFLRLTGSPWRTLLLYLPFVGISLFPIVPNVYDPTPTLHQMITPFTYFAIGPLRYLGPTLTLACLVSVLQRPSRPGFLMLFGIATVSAINNLDFGVPALAAAFTATVLGLSPRAWPSFRLLRSATGCLAISGSAAVLLFVGYTYWRSSNLPNFSAVTMFQRVVAINGFGATPMPVAGMHLVVFVTFMAAIAKGLYTPGLTPLRKGLLLYAGIFGCGALMYFVIRSHPHVLINLFLPWAFAFLLLAWLCWEKAITDIRLLGWRRAYQPAALLLALGYIFPLSGIAALPNPRQQWQRVTLPPVADPFDRERLTADIRSLAVPGEPIMVIQYNGHLACLHAGVRNVFPYACHGSLFLYRQFDVLMEVLDAQQVRCVIDGDDQAILPPLLREHGYEVLRKEKGWVIYVRSDKRGEPRESGKAAIPAEGAE